MTRISKVIANLAVEALSHDGRGIAFLKADGAGRGKAVFITGALPGQTVSCAITADKKSYFEAALVAIETNGPHLGLPLCPQHGQCGGCALQLFTYNTQLYWKERLAQDAFIRVGRFPTDLIKAVWRGIAPSPRTQKYRNKLEFAFGQEADGTIIAGFRKKYSHEITPINSCAIAPDGAVEIAQTCARLACDLGLNGRFLKFLVLRIAQTRDCGKQKWHALCVTGPADRRLNHEVETLGHKLLEARKDLRCFIHEEKRGNAPVARGTKRVFTLDRKGKDIPGSAEIVLPLGTRQFRLDAGSFFQVNPGGASILAEIIRHADATATGSLLDLYCGVGAPGLLLAENHEYTCGIEADETAVKYARKNTDSPKCVYIPGQTAAVLSSHGFKKNIYADGTLLLDPPRGGMDKKTLAAALEIGPKKIIHVACDPVTMARDSLIISQNYNVDSIHSIDMFPQTRHLECCAVWTKKP